MQFKAEAGNVFAFSTKNKKSGIIVSTNVSVTPGKSYRYALEMQSDRPGLATPSVKWGKTTISAKSEYKGNWQKCSADFTVPAGVSKVSLRVWSGGPAPGEFIRFRNVSLKELEK